MQTLCHNWLVTVGSALTGLCACLAAAAELSRVPKPADRAAWDQYIREGWDSPFGLDYVFVLGGEFRKPDLARQLGGFVGVRWVNFARVNWGEIEPKAPVAGKHTYRWAPLDEAVRQWQEQGVHIMMSLRFVCRWANATPSLKPLYLDGLLSWIPKTAADYRPKPEHQQALRDFITALVERYDGDGIGACRRLPMPEYLFVYECTVRGGRKVLVAFCDDHIGQNHDEPLAEMDAVLPLLDGPVRLTHIVTDLDATQPRTELLRAVGGRLSLRLTEYPVFLEPQAK